MKGLITIKDIEKARKYPNSAKDAKGRLLAAAAVGIAVDTMLRAKSWWRLGRMCWWWTRPMAIPEMS